MKEATATDNEYCHHALLDASAEDYRRQLWDAIFGSRCVELWSPNLSDEVIGVQAGQLITAPCYLVKIPGLSQSQSEHFCEYFRAKNATQDQFAMWYNCGYPLVADGVVVCTSTREFGKLIAA
jgi:hypothetical protein